MKGELFIQYTLTEEIAVLPFECQDFEKLPWRQAVLEGLAAGFKSTYSCDCRIHHVFQKRLGRTPDDKYPCGNTDYDIEKILIRGESLTYEITFEK
jgi:hypothetical protein